MSVDSQKDHAGVEPFFPIILLVSAKPAEINTIYQLHIFGVELQRYSFFFWVILTCNFHLLHTNPPSAELPSSLQSGQQRRIQSLSKYLLRELVNESFNWLVCNLQKQP